MTNDQELAGLICNIKRRLNLHGGSELEPEATVAALRAVDTGQLVTWSDQIAPRLSPEQQKFQLVPSQRHELSRLLGRVKDSHYSRRLQYSHAQPLLSAINHGRVVINAGEAVYLRGSSQSNPHQADELLFQNEALASAFQLPIHTFVAADSVAQLALEANHIITLGQLLYLTEEELARLILTGTSTRAVERMQSSKTIPADQIAGLLCELDRRGWHLTRLDKTQPPPETGDEWACLSRDPHTFPVVLKSQLYATLNPVPIAWLFDRYDRSAHRLLRQLGIEMTHQLLSHTEQSLQDLLAQPSVASHEADSLHREIARLFRQIGLRLAIEPTPVV